MTEKQYRKADSMVLPTLLVVMVGIFLNMLGMLGMSEMKAQLLVVTVASVVGVIATIIIYVKLKGKRACGMLMCGMAMIACLLMIVFVDAQFFYMLVAVVLIVQMAYLEKRRLILTAAVVLPVFTIKSMMLVSKGAVSPTEGGTSIIILLVILQIFSHVRFHINYNF